MLVFLIEQVALMVLLSKDYNQHTAQFIVLISLYIIFYSIVSSPLYRIQLKSNVLYAGRKMFLWNQGISASHFDVCKEYSVRYSILCTMQLTVQYTVSWSGYCEVQCQVTLSGSKEGNVPCGVSHLSLIDALVQFIVQFSLHYRVQQSVQYSVDCNMN